MSFDYVSDCHKKDVRIFQTHTDGSVLWVCTKCNMPCKVIAILKDAGKEGE